MSSSLSRSETRSVDEMALEALSTFAEFGLTLAAMVLVIMGWLISSKDSRAFLRGHPGLAFALGVTTTLAITAHTVGMGFYLHYGIDETAKMREFFWPANVCHATINLLLTMNVWILLRYLAKEPPTE